MNIVKKIISNSLIITLSQTAEIFINVVFIVYLGRYFGSVGFGKLSFLNLFIFFIAVMDNQWIRPILIRELSIRKEQSGLLFGNALMIRTVMAIFMMVLLWVIITTINCPQDIRNLLFFACINLLISSLISSYGIILEVELKVGYLKLINFFAQITNMLVLFWVIHLKKDLHTFYILSLIPAAVAFFSVRYYAQKDIKPSFVFNWSIWRKMILNSWPLIATSLFIFLYHRIDQIILMHSKGSEAVGIYSIGVKLAEYFSIIPLALMSSVFPVMSRCFGSRQYFDAIYKLSFKYLLILIVPVSVITILYSRYFMNLFYGQRFLLSVSVLNILIIAEIFVYMGVVNNAILISSSKQIMDPVLTGCSFFVNLLLNLLLIPRYGVIGAAVASLCAYATGPIIGLLFSLTREYSKCMFYYLLKPLIAALTMGYLLRYLNLPVLLSILLSPLIYLAILFFISGIDKSDFEILKLLAKEQ